MVFEVEKAGCFEGVGYGDGDGAFLSRSSAKEWSKINELRIQVNIRTEGHIEGKASYRDEGFVAIRLRHAFVPMRSTAPSPNSGQAVRGKGGK